MKSTKFERIMRSLIHTQDQEISCSDCFDQVSDYVDLEIAGENAATKMPQTKQHLDQCRVCREEYETLLELASISDKDTASM
jgi:hypothetical protein